MHKTNVLKLKDIYIYILNVLGYNIAKNIFKKNIFFTFLHSQSCSFYSYVKNNYKVLKLIISY